MKFSRFNPNKSILTSSFRDIINKEIKEENENDLESTMHKVHSSII